MNSEQRSTVRLEQAKYHNPLKRALAAAYAKRVYAAVLDRAPGRTLEVGVGTGGFWTAVGRAGFPEYGCDLNRDCLRLNEVVAARKKINASLASLPFVAGAFDTVIAIEVLEHCSDHRAALRQLCRVARRHVVVGVPWEPWFQLATLLSGRFLRTLGNNPNHVHRFTRSAFETLLSSHGELLHAATSLPWQFGILRVRNACPAPGAAG